MSAAMHRPIANGRLGTPSRKRSPYRTKSYGSEVDETLFGTPTRYNQQQDTPRINPDDVTWDPPWATSLKKSGAPLLWSPYGQKDSDNLNSAKKGIRSTTPRGMSTTKNKYRPKKHVPSYVDETLFGTPRKTQQLKAPWATDDDHSTGPPVTWSPPLAGANLDSPIHSQKIEPKTGSEAGSMHYTPVIKARQGSTLTTPNSQSRSKPMRKEYVSSSPRVQQKLDFCIENGANNASEEHDDPDAIVERALRLAGISKNGTQSRYRSNSLGGLSTSSRASTPGRYFWKRPSSPASSTGRPDTGQSSRLSTHSNGKRPDLQVEDLFSATGTRMPLSARGTPRRPDSARTVNSEDSVPGLDLSRPSKMYGLRTPRSARSNGSTQSSISNRPSWRP